MIGWYLKRVDPVLARVWRVSTEKSVHELNNWEVEKDAWVRGFHEQVYTYELQPRYTQWFNGSFGQVWDVRGFDAIIGPGLASPALVHE